MNRLFDRLHGDDAADAEAAAREVRRRGKVVVVSACLTGEPVRYDGRDKHDPAALARVGDATVLPLCPEVLGGLGCPRLAITLDRGDGAAVLDGHAEARDQDGRDLRAALVAGATRAVALARAGGATRAILKERSPSCGSHEVHTPRGIQPGMGVAAAAFARAGFVLENEQGSR
jgi:uncharacterized protein YbbK (DUF523 family)